MQIDRIEEWCLTAVDEAQIVLLLSSAFDTAFSERSYYMQRHHFRLVARDPEIVAHMGLLFRTVRQGDRLIPIMGLADVATDIKRRGQGIASALLAAAISEAKESIAEFFLLFGDAAIYAGMGFRSAPNSLRFVDLTDAKTGDVRENNSDDLMVLELQDAKWDPDTPLDLIGNKF